MVDNIREQLTDHRRVIDFIEDNLVGEISSAATAIVEALQRGNKILIMGNGGSAADAQHMAAEIVGRFRLERKGLPALALTTDTSILTSVGNDYGFESIFSRQVEALAVAGDLVIGISTSGNSPNVKKALDLAREVGCRTIGLLGKDGGPIKDRVDMAIIVAAIDTPRIQEGHTTIIHIICDLVERACFRVKPVDCGSSNGTKGCGVPL
jgi:D-sedoheptulose 7-phosphate isomerase